MNIVRLKVRDENKNKKVFLVILAILILLILILVFNPFGNVKTNFLSMKEKNMNRTPTYESLKNTTLVGGVKYSIPVITGKVIVNNDNSMNIKAEPGMRVKSIDDGIIFDIGTNEVYGNYIEISYTKIKKEEIYAFYGYLEKPLTGDVIVIQDGQKIGEIGDRGYIFFELRDKNHNTLNPYEYMNLKTIGY